MHRHTEIRRLQDAARDALISGSTAAMLSGAVLSWRSSADEGAPAGGLNGPSQWLWGERGGYARQLSLGHTGVGYLIHHGTSIFWAIAYERLFGA
jgi:hypothetical protein